MKYAVMMKNNFYETNPIAATLAQEYLRLSKLPQLSELEADKMTEILEKALLDDRLNYLIGECEKQLFDEDENTNLESDRQLEKLLKLVETDDPLLVASIFDE